MNFGLFELGRIYTQGELLTQINASILRVIVDSLVTLMQMLFRMVRIERTKQSKMARLDS